MVKETLKVANSPGLWVCSLITVILVFVQMGLYLRLANKEANRIGFEQSKLKKSFGIGFKTAVGPAMAGFVVLVGMVSALGMPITWMRLSIIGSASTELTAATVAAESMGITFGGPEYGLEALSLAFFTMAVNVAGWLLVAALFTHKMEDIRIKLGGGDKKWISLITVSAGIGVFSNLSSTKCVGGFAPLAATIASVVTMFILIKYINPKVKGLSEWSLAICMIVSMIAGTITEGLI